MTDRTRELADRLDALFAQYLRGSYAHTWPRELSKAWPEISALLRLADDCGLQLLEIAALLAKHGRICSNNERVPDVVAEMLRQRSGPPWTEDAQCPDCGAEEGFDHFPSCKRYVKREPYHAQPAPAESDGLIAEIDAFLADAPAGKPHKLLQRARDRIAEDTQTMQTQNLRLARYEQRIVALEGALREILDAIRRNRDDPSCTEDERQAFGEDISIVLNTARRVARLELDPEIEPRSKCGARAFDEAAWL